MTQLPLGAKRRINSFKLLQRSNKMTPSRLCRLTGKASKKIDYKNQKSQKWEKQNPLACLLAKGKGVSKIFA